MLKKNTYLIVLLFFIAFTSCIKETYDMNKLSDEVHYSPSLLLAAANGSITLSDIIKPGDTVRFDNDNFVRIVLKKESVIDFKLNDYVDLTDMVSYSKGYKLGEVTIKDFQNNLSVSFNTIVQALSPSLRAIFLALDNGLPHIFPPFPVTVIPEQSFSTISDFQNVVFSSGTLEISVKNNLQAPLNDIKIRLYNSTGHTPIGNELTIPAINPGATKSAVLDLAGKTVTNKIVAAITFNGSPGTSTPVIIDLDHSVNVGIYGSNLKIQSGRVKIPAQTINIVDNLDTFSINPGNNIEIEKFKIKTGNISYHLISTSNLGATVTITFPSAVRTGVPIIEIININPRANINKSISFSDTEIDLSTDPTQKYNRIPVKYAIAISSAETLIDFNKNDSIHIDMELLNPDFDYVKGYFGQLTEQIDPDTLETDIDNILSHISGQIHISDPNIKINYTNSFGIPVEVTFNATGVKNSQSVNLGLAPFIVSYPTSLTQRTVSSSFTVNKINSSLPDLISLPPHEVRFSGSGKMNPLGFTGVRNNYVFGNSQFNASIEVEVPLVFWINNLQFSDTLDNFLKPDKTEKSSFNPEDIKLLLLNLKVDNGFPLGASLKLMLYDSATKSVIKTIEATDIIKAAPVDVNGKTTGFTESSTTIECDKSFFEASKKSDKMIFVFTMNSTGGGTKDVRIYSDYALTFSIAVKVKPDLKL